MELVGPWDETMTVLEDKEWWIRAAEHEVGGVPLKGMITYKYRQHEGSLVATYRETDTWKDALSYIKNQHIRFFEGEYPMCCGDNKLKKPNPSFAPTLLGAVTAGAGQIKIHYMLGTGDATYWGPSTGQKYVVSASHPDVVVADADAVTNDRRKPGLLELTRNSRPVFVKVP
jgi:hypothetical protein